MKIAIIGTGNLGKSIAKGLLSTPAINSLYLTKRNLSELEEFKENEHVFVTSNNIEAIQNSDNIILAVQPSHLEGVLQDIKPFLKDNHLLISTITGFSISKIEAIVGEGSSIIRAMPNTAIAPVGEIKAPNNKQYTKSTSKPTHFNK